MRTLATRIALALLLVAAAVVGIENLQRPLANPDEGRYSEISREMVASGDWVTPRLNGLKYFEKPPLQYWATALSFRLFRESEWSARLYVALCGFATLLILGYTALKIGSADVAVAAVLALVSSPYFMALGGIVTLDTGLTLWTTLTLCAFLIAESAPGTARRRWMLVAWAATALAVLSKGLVGIVFPAAAAFTYMLLRRDWTLLRRLEWTLGLIVFFAITVPWFVAVSAANPEFAQFFFVHEHFTRFLTHEHRRVEPWWYFVPIVFVGFLPWMFALPAAIASALGKERALPSFRPLTFALLWSLFVVGFFSASGSKLPAYILPAFPALALVLARYLVDAPPRRLALWLAPTIAVALVLGYFAWRMPELTRDPWSKALNTQAQPDAYLAALFLFLGASLATFMLWMERRGLALVTVAFAVVGVIACVENAYEVFSPRQSGIEVARKMKPFVTPATRIYSVGHYDQTVPFYIGRTVTLVDYVDEFELGLGAEPGRNIEHVADFPAEWLRPGDALAIMQPDLYTKLKAQGLPMQVLHSDPRRILVRKP